MATSVGELETTEIISQAEQCLNCGAVLMGEHCHACGQKKIHRHEFAIRHFFSHVLHEVTHLDSNKILKTLYALLLQPGLLTADYLAGRKGRHINPIRIYLTFSAIYFLFAWGALTNIRSGGVRDPRLQRTITVMAQKKGVDAQALGDKLYQKAEKYAAILRFASVLVSGLMLTFLYYGSGRYYVEHMIFSLHYYSFDFFCKSVFALLFIISGAAGLQLPAQALNLFYPVALIYLIFALRRVYGQPWPLTLLKSVVLFAWETLLFIAVNMLGFIIAFSFA
jgi:hypothetical protein